MIFSQSDISLYWPQGYSSPLLCVSFCVCLPSTLLCVPLTVHSYYRLWLHNVDIRFLTVSDGRFVLFDPLSVLCLRVSGLFPGWADCGTRVWRWEELTLCYVKITDPVSQTPRNNIVGIGWLNDLQPLRTRVEKDEKRKRNKKVVSPILYLPFVRPTWWFRSTSIWLVSYDSTLLIFLCLNIGDFK